MTQAPHEALRFGSFSAETHVKFAAQGRDEGIAKNDRGRR